MSTTDCLETCYNSHKYLNLSIPMRRNKQIVLSRLFYTLISLTLLLLMPTLSAQPMTFTEIENPEQFIAEQKQAALENNKKILWVLGSQWCHDSRSLERKLHLPKMASILADYYQTSLIDVSYLSEGFDFTELVGMRTYYATPTVLIIDPETMSLINAEDMHIWSNAYKISEQETHDYFLRYGSLDVRSEQTDAPELTADQQALLAELSKYVKSQERRIQASYLVIGPMLEAYKKGEADRKFDRYWNALAKIRMQLPQTIADNKAMIMALNAGESTELKLPEDKPLPWE